MGRVEQRGSTRIELRKEGTTIALERRLISVRAERYVIPNHGPGDPDIAAGIKDDSSANFIARATKVSEELQAFALWPHLGNKDILRCTTKLTRPRIRQGEIADTSLEPPPI